MLDVTSLSVASMSNAQLVSFIFSQYEQWLEYYYGPEIPTGSIEDLLKEIEAFLFQTFFTLGETGTRSGSFTEQEDSDGAVLLNSKPDWTLRELLSVLHPGDHLFYGDGYLPLGLEDPYLKEKEEDESPFTEARLTGLGECKIYPELGRITYFTLGETGTRSGSYTILDWYVEDPPVHKTNRVEIGSYRDQLRLSLDLLNTLLP